MAKIKDIPQEEFTFDDKVTFMTLTLHALGIYLDCYDVEQILEVEKLVHDFKGDISLKQIAELRSKYDEIRRELKQNKP